MLFLIDFLLIELFINESFLFAHDIQVAIEKEKKVNVIS